MKIFAGLFYKSEYIFWIWVFFWLRIVIPVYFGVLTFNTEKRHTLLIFRRKPVIWSHCLHVFCDITLWYGQTAYFTVHGQMDIVTWHCVIQVRQRIGGCVNNYCTTRCSAISLSVSVEFWQKNISLLFPLQLFIVATIPIFSILHSRFSFSSSGVWPKLCKMF